ncbi:MAG: PmeII family type II restriction endonuclease [Dehalococcoidia bacterium]
MTNEAVHAALRDYVDRRLHFYRTKRLRDLLSKDVLMFALRGVATSDGFVEQAFAALESSSEETTMGHTWQRILKDLAEPAVIDAGDFLAEREGALWVIEEKSQTNTLNASSLAQTVRALKDRVERYRTFQQARRQPVKAMIGVMRGREDDREMRFPAGGPRTENRDLEGFEYRYIVGPAFWRWLTGRPSILSLIGDFTDATAVLVEARQDCLARLQLEIAELLAQHSLPPTIASVITLTFENDDPAATP